MGVIDNKKITFILSNVYKNFFVKPGFNLFIITFEHLGIISFKIYIH